MERKPHVKAQMLKIEESVGDDKGLLFDLPRLRPAGDLFTVVLRLEKRPSWKVSKMFLKFQM